MFVLKYNNKVGRKRGCYRLTFKILNIFFDFECDKIGVEVEKQKDLIISK